MFEILFMVVVLIAGSITAKRLDRIEQKIDALTKNTTSTPKESPAVVAQAKRTEVKREYAEALSVESLSRDDTPLTHIKDPVTTTTEKDFSPLQRNVETSTGQREESVLPENTEPTILTRFFHWLREDWPMKVGGILIILSVGWFVTYAADQGWLSETARVVLGYVFGIIALIYGSLRAEKITLQGNVFIIIGIAAIFIATIAGVDYDTVQLTSASALIVMFATVMCVALISLRQKSLSLTASMLFFGGMMPLFFQRGLSTEFTFLYLIALTAGTLWIVYRTGWRSLTALALTIVGFYSTGHALDIGLPDDTVSTSTELLLAAIFTLIFYTSNIAAIVTSRKIVRADIFIAIALGVFYTLWMYWFAPEATHVYILTCGALSFVIGATLIYHYTKITLPTVLYGVIAGALLTLATALQFDGSTLVIAYLVEYAASGFLLLWLSERSNTEHSLGNIFLVGGFLAVCALLSIPVLKLLTITRHASDTSIINDALIHLFTLIVASVAFGALYYAAEKYKQKEKFPEDLTLPQLFAFACGMMLISLVWFTTHVFLQSSDVATLISLVIYTLAGTLLYVAGTRDDDHHVRFVGIALFVLVLMRIFFVEFWEMSMGVRIITFFVVGGILIASAFMTHRHKK